ncbi:hypothetical protein [Spirillospora sp. NPDC029432]|uniref:hypothetical protein n=1 Tax=Spirillospora sp. NPDC029432 TaxID=3154599 RepID=UPI0034545C85
MTAALAAIGLLGGCATEEVVVERSFTDKHGRACTYVLVKDWERDERGRTLPELDAENIDCDAPPAGGGRP